MSALRDRAARAVAAVGAAFAPQGPTLPRVALIQAAGALVGILATAAIGHFALGAAALPFIVAPMGASAVLLFAVPASPLAQPRAILFGNLAAACVGVAAAQAIPVPVVAAAVAVGGAVLVMIVLRALHPPGGAMALSAVLGGPAISAAGYGYAFGPVLLNCLTLLATGLVFNRLAGVAYPHVVRPVPAPGPAAPMPTRADVLASLEDLHDRLDVAPDDVVALIRDASARAARRKGKPR